MNIFEKRNTPYCTGASNSEKDQSSLNNSKAAAWWGEGIPVTRISDMMGGVFNPILN